jgi:N-acetylglucosaminyl-diphospho-decaprenol L-rhamnosyltransferase
MAGTSVAAVIVNYRTPDLALQCLEALDEERANVPDLRVILVDGGSNDGSAEKLEAALSQRRCETWVDFLPLPINGGFGWANNQAIQGLLQSANPPEYVLLLNPDAAVSRGSIRPLIDVLDRYPNCAAAGSQLLTAKGEATVSAATFPGVREELYRGSRLGLLRHLLGLDEPCAILPDGEYDWVTGASVMFRCEALRQVGLFDTGFFLYFEEVELMWRLRKNAWTVRHVPQSRLSHIGGASTGVDVDTADATSARRPRYWYESRRRFFALTLGASRCVQVSLAWLAGYALFKTRRLLGGAHKHRETAHEARDLLRHGIWPTRRDRTPAIARWDDPLGIPPAWMASGD